jgi:hypothetical protein
MSTKTTRSVGGTFQVEQALRKTIGRHGRPIPSNPHSNYEGVPEALLQNIVSSSCVPIFVYPDSDSLPFTI